MNDPAKQPDHVPPGLNTLLREWHDVNADRAAHGRDLLVERLRKTRRAEQTRAAAPRLPGPLDVLAGFAQRMVANGGLQVFELDTVAVAMFLGRDFDSAVKYGRKAIAADPTSRVYTLRLEIYETARKDAATRHADPKRKEIKR